MGHSQYSAPKVFQNEMYAANKADVFSVGLIIYKLAFNEYPYLTQNEIEDQGFWNMVHGHLDVYIRMCFQKKYTNQKMTTCIISMLNIDQDERPDACQLLENEWFAAYWRRYSSQIVRNQSDKRELTRTTRRSQ